ncbi:prepilin-type N-terminal cleavage/methylation domain-containing protein [Planctomycetales bacterium ZRK34]|nr:prepilin-type N-terminal cleavage/methylation domain-containing protein [Planctomycetales bacterium ZRK34]
MTRSSTQLSQRVATDRFALQGFTLIEMLVVIAIIIALLGLLIGGIGRFSQLSNAAATKQMLASISAALGNYDMDCKSMPPSYVASGTMGGTAVDNEWQGAELMTQAIVAPRNDDGKTGDGFKANGKEYGPYLNLKNDNTIFATDKTGTQPNYRYALTMASSAAKKPILYYEKNPAGSSQAFITYPDDINAPGGTKNTVESTWIWGPSGMFNTKHNEDFVSGTDGKDIVENYWARLPNGAIATDESDDGPTRERGETLAFQLRSAKYLLVAAGNDDKYGTEDDVVVTGK